MLNFTIMQKIILALSVCCLFVGLFSLLIFSGNYSAIPTWVCVVLAVASVGVGIMALYSTDTRQAYRAYSVLCYASIATNVVAIALYIAHAVTAVAVVYYTAVIVQLLGGTAIVTAVIMYICHNNRVQSNSSQPIGEEDNDILDSIKGNKK